MLLKSCTQNASKFGKLGRGHTTGKGWFRFQSQRSTMPNNIQTPAQLHSFHMLATQCSKSLKLGFNSTWMVQFQMFKLDWETAEEPGIILPAPTGSRREQRVSRKTPASAPLTVLAPSPVWTATDCGEFLTRRNIRPPRLSLEKPACTSRSTVRTGWNNGLVPNWERSTSRLYTVTLLI